MFKNMVKDYFKAHSSIHFSQMHVSTNEEAHSYEDGLFSDDNITEMFATNREYDTIIQAIDKLS